MVGRYVFGQHFIEFGGQTMGRLSMYVAVAVGILAAAAPRAATAPDDEAMDRLLDAIAKVESQNNPTAVGDGGKAAGAYQIHRRYWADATKFLGVEWDYRKARDPDKARQVVRAYLRHYGKGKSLLDMARIHNGGPRGYRKAATLAYARKIEQALEKDEAQHSDG
jgi:hypothetical protein